MYTLYYSPGACSMAVHVVLNELAVPYALEKTSIGDGQTKTPTFLKLNPRGAVPVLTDDGFVVREGAAIFLYLFDKHPSALMPAKGREHATAVEWLMFANATMHPAYAKAFFLNKQLKENAAASPLMKAACDQINALWADVEKQLGTSEYVCGKECTVADILLTVIANWSVNFGSAIVLGANVKRLLKTITARPAYQKALTDEDVKYKAA